MLRIALGTAALWRGNAPIRLLVETNDWFRTVSVDYHVGLRYPELERTSTGKAGLDRLRAAK